MFQWKNGHHYFAHGPRFRQSSVQCVDLPEVYRKIGLIWEMISSTVDALLPRAVCVWTAGHYFVVPLVSRSHSAGTWVLPEEYRKLELL